MEYLLCAASLCCEDIGIHQAWQLFPEGLQCQENKPHVWVNKCGGGRGLRNPSSVTRKFMSRPDGKGEGLGVRDVFYGLGRAGKFPRRGEGGSGV